MEIFESRYFIINRNLMMTVGLWPYATRTKSVVRIFSITVLLLLSLPQITAAIVHHKDIDRLMFSLLAYMTILNMLFKIVSLTVAEDNMSKVYAGIATNWQIIRDEQERAILVEYSERARQMTILYSGGISIIAVAMCMLPMLPKIMDAINPLDKPRANVYEMHGEMFIDRETHYWLFYFWDCATSVAVILACSSFDSMYIATIEHCCALYAIVGHQLRNLRQADSEDSTANEAEMFHSFIKTVKLHQKALSFSDKINSSYSMCFLLITVMNIFLIPLCACAILISISMHNYFSLLMYISYFGGVAFHLGVFYLPGQRILDHGDSLHDDCYDNEWYSTYPRTKKLLLIIMQRCTQPTLVTAGGLFVMNYESYMKIMKTAISYITVLASFR